MDLDPTVVIPAILFTVVAIYFASSLLRKKSDASSAAARNKQPKVGYEDDVPPSRALGEQLQPEVSPPTEPPAPAERIQDVPVKVEPETVKEPEPVPEPEQVQEPEPVPETVLEPVSAQEVAAVSEAVPEPELVPEPVEVSEPVEVPEPVEVSEPEAVSDPEPLVESEPVPEVLPLVEDILPELIPRFAEEILLTPELLIETERESEPEDLLNDDVAAAEDQVKFTPGKKQSKFESMMTKEEIEEEQRAPE